MRHALVAALFLTAIPGLVSAEDVDVDPDSQPDTVSMRLGAWSIGPSIGVVSALTDPLLSQDPQLLSLSLAQTIRFGTNWDLGLDAGWWAPGGNWGGSATLAYVFGAGAFQPFIGAGAGLRALDYENESFSRGLGVEGTVHAGLYLDVMDHLQLRVRAPWRFIANSNREQVAGLDVALLFSSPLRKTTVRRLSY